MGFQAPPPEPIRLFLCPPSQKPVFTFLGLQEANYLSLQQ